MGKIKIEIVEPMDYAEFRAALLDGLRKVLGGGYEVYLQSLPNLNGTRKDLIAVRRRGCKNQIVPFIGIGKCYKKYAEFGFDMDETVMYVAVMAFTFGEILESENLDLSFFSDWAKIKKHVTGKLINRATNGELLSIAPHENLLNLGMVYYVMFESGGRAEAGIPITNTILDVIGVRRNELHEAAIRNMNERMFFGDVQNVLIDLAMTDFPEKLGEVMKAENRFGMYVLSNQTKKFGAASIVSADIRKRIIKSFGCGAFVLPSSIHELLLVPKRESVDLEYLRKNIRNNNRQLEEDEWLSDNLYFLAVDGTLSIV